MNTLLDSNTVGSVLDNPFIALIVFFIIITSAMGLSQVAGYVIAQVVLAAQSFIKGFNYNK